MNTTDAVSTVAERLDEQDPEELPEPAESALKRIQPYLGDDGRSATLAAVTGAVSLVRAVRTLRKGDRKRGLIQLLAGVFWVGLAVAQRQRSRASVDETDVVDTGPDIESVETDDRDTEPATGEEVVNTTDADIDESDTAPEVDSDVDAEDADVDQRDVADTDEVESAAESQSGDEGGGDEEAGTETAD